MGGWGVTSRASEREVAEKQGRMRCQCPHRHDHRGHRGLERGGAVEPAHLHLVLLELGARVLPDAGGPGLVPKVGGDVLARSGAVRPQAVRPPRVEPVGLRFDEQDLELAAAALGLPVAHGDGVLICCCWRRGVGRCFVGTDACGFEILDDILWAAMYNRRLVYDIFFGVMHFNSLHTAHEFSDGTATSVFEDGFSSCSTAVFSGITTLILVRPSHFFFFVS